MDKKPTSKFITITPSGGTNMTSTPWTDLSGQSAVFDLAVG